MNHKNNEIKFVCDFWMCFLAGFLFSSATTLVKLCLFFLTTYDIFPFPLAVPLLLTILVTSCQCYFQFFCYPVATVKCWQSASATFHFHFFLVSIQLHITNSAVLVSVASVAWLSVNFSILIYHFPFLCLPAPFQSPLISGFGNFFSHPEHLFSFIRMHDTVVISPFPESFIFHFLALKNYDITPLLNLDYIKPIFKMNVQPISHLFLVDLNFSDFSISLLWSLSPSMQTLSIPALPGTHNLCCPRQ